MPIRAATAADVDSIRDIAAASWKNDYPDVLSRESIDEGIDEWYSEAHIRESILWSRSDMLVYERDDDVVGFVHADYIQEDAVGHVLRLYVHPEYRGQGIGSALLETACRTLFEEGATLVRAMVLEENDLGDRFYREFGFEPVATEEVSIGDEYYRETTYELLGEALTEMAELNSES